MKVLIANDRISGGGVEKVLETLTRYFVVKGYGVSLMVPDCTKDDVVSMFGDTVKCYPLLRKTKKCKRFTFSWFLDRGVYFFQRYVYKTRFFRERFDVIIALKEGPTMIMLADLYAKHKYAWVHVDYRYMHWTKGCFQSSKEEIQCMRKFDKVICVSKASRDSVIETIGDPGNLCVRYNPIDYKKIQKESNQIPDEIKRKGAPLFVAIGRLAYQKNFGLLLDVCGELAKKTKFELWIIGDGPEREQLQNKIDELGLTCVSLLGARENPYPYLKQADVFVSTSIWESYGIAIQEALILEKPVITVSCPAIEETFDQRYGILVKNDFNSVYSAMEQMIIDNELRNDISFQIKSSYQMDDLYEKRLQNICGLWETNE